MAKAHLYELDAFHGASGHIHRWFLATGPRGYRSWPSDTPSSVTWLPLVGQWPSVGIVAGGSDASAGPRIDDLLLINVRSADNLPRYANVYDVTADAWLRVELGERPLNILLTDYVVQRITEKEVDEDAPYSAAVTIWRGKAGRPAPERKQIRLPVYDRAEDFDTPVQVDKYPGTDAPGPSTTAGGEGLKDMTRERCLGHVPICIPTYIGADAVSGCHMYSASGLRPIEGVVRAWDKASPYTSVTGTPSTSGQYSVDNSNGIILVGGAAKPEDFRIEIKGEKVDGVWLRYIGEIIAFLATDAGIVTETDVSGMDAVPRTVGIYLSAGDNTTHRDLYTKLVGSVPRGRWFTDLEERLVVTRLPRPAEVLPIRTYRQSVGGTPGLKPLTGRNAPPAKQVIVRFAENSSASDQTAGVATAEDVALWSKQWREAASVTDADIVAAWGASAKVEYVDTMLTLRTEAEAEAPAWLVEKSDPPQPYELPVSDGAPGLWIGDAIMVVDSVAGFERGDVVVIYGRTNRDRGGGATLYVEAQTTEPRLLTEDGFFLTTEDDDFLIVG